MKSHQVIIEPAFKIRQRVWHVLNGEDSAGLVTGLLVRENEILYRVVWGDKEEQTHYECELSSEKVAEF